MHGHPQELRQEERLLHEASEMALRAGQMAAASRASHGRAALLQQKVGAASHARASTRSSEAAAVASEARELSGIAAQESKLARADQRLLKETAGVASAAASS